ncbi:hypothetical protein AB1339_03150 [Streptomyces cyaneofuscatus]|uniref:hypothetical protein n=1 Tax=Streptomyces cyaneofuscatus TaxID=66883 RepID=UPI00345DC842
MAMGEAWIGLLGAMGGAGIGATGTLLVQRAKRRDDAVLARAVERHAEDVLHLETLATARARLRAWWVTVEGLGAALEAGRPVDLQQYQSQLEIELKEFATALYRIPAHAVPEGRGTVPISPAVIAEMVRISNRLIDAAHDDARNTMTARQVTGLRTEGDELASRTGRFLLACTEKLTRRPFPNSFYNLLQWMW